MDDPTFTVWLQRVLAILVLTVVIALCVALVVYVWGKVL